MCKQKLCLLIKGTENRLIMATSTKELFGMENNLVQFTLRSVEQRMQSKFKLTWEKKKVYFISFSEKCNQQHEFVWVENILRVRIKLEKKNEIVNSLI